MPGKYFNPHDNMAIAIKSMPRLAIGNISSSRDKRKNYKW